MLVTGKSEGRRKRSIWGFCVFPAQFFCKHESAFKNMYIILKIKQIVSFSYIQGKEIKQNEKNYWYTTQHRCISWTP